jgi:hypothetical protein
VATKQLNQYRPDPVAKAVTAESLKDRGNYIGAIANGRSQGALMVIQKYDLLMPGFHGRLLKYCGPFQPVPVNKLPSQFVKDGGSRVVTNTSTGQTIEASTLEEANQQYLDSGIWTGAQNFKVIASVDKSPFGPLLHLSMSYPNHDPSWNEIKSIRTLFFPEWMDVSMGLPPISKYINVHQFCFQLHQQVDLDALAKLLED